MTSNKNTLTPPKKNITAPEKNITSQKIAEKSSAAMHSNDHCAHTLGITVNTVAPGCASASMMVSQEFANGYGYCQGGIITTLADTAFAHACNSYNQITVGQGLSIEFVRSAKIGELLTANASEQSRGKLIGVYQVQVINPAGKLVAIMTGKSFSRQRPIFDEPMSGSTD